MYQRTTALKKLLQLKKRIRGVAGGTSASKTISIIQILIDYAQTHENEVISIVSESLPHLKRGAMRDFLNIMETHRYYKDQRWNRSDYVYTFETGTKIEFFGADQSDKVRGPRRNVLFVNEANNISYETFTQLEIRTSDIVWLDWNPVAEFWFYTEVLSHLECDFVTLTYRDNEGLPEGVVKALEARRFNEGWWKVYGEGQLGVSEGRIYKNWIIIDDLPQNRFEIRLERLGLDFGYTNDPTVLEALYKHNQALLFDQLLYRYGMSNKDIADFILASEFRDALVIADSAEPKSIDEIKSYGVNIIGADKGKDSVRQGIQYIQNQTIEVTKRSVETIKEYRNYLWLIDKDGKITNNPSPIWNHAMDTIRYAVSGYFSNLPGTYYVPSKETLLERGARSQFGGFPL